MVRTNAYSNNPVESYSVVKVSLFELIVVRLIEFFTI